MSAAVSDERDLARRYVRSLTTQGALLIPPNCTFVRIAIELMDLALRAGQLHGCEHRAHETKPRFTVIPTYGDPGHALGPHCLDCFERLPAQLVCQVCLRTPSPGLRTVVFWNRRHQTRVMLGRLCRDCRPGRVS
jgi:hypothetical protein